MARPCRVGAGSGKPSPPSGRRYLRVVEVDRGQALRQLVRDIADFPLPGVVYKDITPLLGDASGFAGVVDGLVDGFADQGVDQVVGIEARGFILGGPVAYRLGAGFVPVRKAGKLPSVVEGETYTLEYGTDLLEIHADAVRAGTRVLIVDDVLATGGTAAATVRLVERLGAEVVGLAFVIELGFLAGRDQLGGREIVSLVTYAGAEVGTS
ncbi:MAG: adenine phosphoribosyltransferase [Actinobacteria bacterium]|nr:adenine phosphoribosyltransferase [Actinomycetota bacterium]